MNCKKIWAPVNNKQIKPYYHLSTIYFKLYFIEVQIIAALGYSLILNAKYIHQNKLKHMIFKKNYSSIELY